MEKQICKACNIEKDVSSFAKRSDRKYKYERRCNECKENKIYIDKTVFTDTHKKCSICLKFKLYSEFNKCRGSRGGIMSLCKICHREKTKKYVKSLPKEVIQIRKRLTYEKHKGKYNEKRREWAIKNKDRINKVVRERNKIRMQTDHDYKFRRNTSALIKYHFIKTSQNRPSNKSKTLDILGCSFEEFKNHIESQFLNWMNWDNFGNCPKNIKDYNQFWDLDHIIPISSADNIDEIIKLNHWSNFQPLCSRVNRWDKKDKIYPVCNIVLKITKL